MVAAGLLSIVIFGLSAGFSNSLKLQKQISTKIKILEVEKNIRTLLRNDMKNFFTNTSGLNCNNFLQKLSTRSGSGAYPRFEPRINNSANFCNSRGSPSPLLNKNDSLCGLSSWRVCFEIDFGSTDMDYLVITDPYIEVVFSTRDFNVGLPVTTEDFLAKVGSSSQSQIYLLNEYFIHWFYKNNASQQKRTGSFMISM